MSVCAYHALIEHKPARLACHALLLKGVGRTCTGLDHRAGYFRIVIGRVTWNFCKGDLAVCMDGWEEAPRVSLREAACAFNNPLPSRKPGV